MYIFNHSKDTALRSFRETEGNVAAKSLHIYPMISGNLFLRLFDNN